MKSEDVTFNPAPWISTINISWAARWCVGCPRNAVPTTTSTWSLPLSKSLRNSWDSVPIRTLRLYDLANLCTCIYIYIHGTPFAVERWKHVRQSLSTIHQTMHWNISAIRAIKHSELQLVCTFERWWRGGTIHHIYNFIYNRDMMYNK